MRRVYRQLLIVSAAALGLLPAGCASVCEDDLLACHDATWDLANTSQTYADRSADADRYSQGLADSNLQAERDLESARGRNQELETALADMEKRYNELLNNQWTPQPSPLPAQTTNRLNELAQRYPGSFEFDPATGISKFNTDILFATGKDQLRNEAQQMLGDFAGILNDPEVYDYNVMIVGHTDDRRIARQETRAKHPTNWHLSAHRAIAVEQYLGQSGVADQRMGVAGYGPNQPLVPNESDANRQLNRRVEIYVLAPDSTVAGMGQSKEYRSADAGASLDQPYIDK